MISLLITKIPFLLNIATFFKHKKRLAIEYFLIAVLIAVAGFTFTLWLAKGKTELHLANAKTQLVTVQSRLDVVEEVNQRQEDTITELKSLRMRDAKALTGLIDDYKFLAENDDLARQKLSNLEKSNETVRNYLNQRIPPDLACVLNNTCASTKNSD